MYHPIYENLSLQCKKHGTSITALCAEITGSSGNLATWKKGKIYANDLLAIKNKFNISIDDILEDKKSSSLEQINTNLSSTENMPPLLMELAELSKDKDFINSAKLYKAVDSEYKKQICAYILGIATALGVNIAQVLGK